MPYNEEYVFLIPYFQLLNRIMTEIRKIRSEFNIMIGKFGASFAEKSEIFICFLPLFWNCLKSAKKKVLKTSYVYNIIFICRQPAGIQRDPTYMNLSL